MEVELWCDGEQGLHTRASALVEHVSPAVVIPVEEESELEPEPQPFLILEPSITEGPHEKDLLIESLRQENKALSTALQSLKSEAQKVMKRRRQEESRSWKKCKQKEKEQGIRAEKLEQDLHEAKAHLNSLQLSSQAAEQRSLTAQGWVMVFVLTIVAVCRAFVYRGRWSAVAGVHACLGFILMLVVIQPVVALFRLRPGAPTGYSFGRVHWAVAMSACIMAVVMVHPRGRWRLLGINERTLGLPDPRGGCRHRMRVDERNLYLPDPGAGYRHRLGMDVRTLDLRDPRGRCRHRSGQDEKNFGLPDPGVRSRLLGEDERNLGLPDPGVGCRHRSCCLSQET